MKLLFDYIEFYLNQTFYRLPKGISTNLPANYEKVFDQVTFDANSKYAGRLEINSEEGLLDLVQKEPTIEAVLLYRVEREIFLNDPTSNLLPFLASMMHRRTGSEIYYSTEIGKGFNIQHGFGIIIGPRFKIGDFFTIHQGVTLGQKNLNSPSEIITIGNNVTIFAGAMVLGNLKIGNNAQIGANSVLLTDVEDNSVYAGVPAKRKL